jgi:hypothetical protein
VQREHAVSERAQCDAAGFGFLPQNIDSAN